MARHPFIVHVATLRRDPAARRREHRRGPVPDLAVTASRVPVGAEVVVDVALEWVHGGILATGTVSAPWSGECRRCLSPAGGELRASVRELFEEGGDPEVTYPLHGDHLDLEPLARDAVMLELPLAPLCREDCQGLCPVCGANRNQGPCLEHLDTTDPRWSALEILREASEPG